MYNFMLALAIGALAFVAGEVISSLTKAWIPSVFISAVIMLLGYWTVFPHDLVSDANLIAAMPYMITVVLLLVMSKIRMERQKKKELARAAKLEEYELEDKNDRTTGG